MGRNTAGVRAIELEEGDQVVGLARTEPDRDQVLAICERGFGKRTPLSEFRQQNRGGKGIILIDASDRNGPVVGLALVRPLDDVMIITDRGQTIRIPVGEIRETGRNAQGVKLMSVEDDERVVALELMGENAAVDAVSEDEAPTGDGVSNGASETSSDSNEANAGEAEGSEDGGGSEEGSSGNEEGSGSEES
jgi:DNA gyrase subunit A